MFPVMTLVHLVADPAAPPAIPPTSAPFFPPTSAPTPAPAALDPPITSADFFHDRCGARLTAARPVLTHTTRSA